MKQFNNHGPAATSSLGDIRQGQSHSRFQCSYLPIKQTWHSVVWGIALFLALVFSQSVHAQSNGSTKVAQDPATGVDPDTQLIDADYCFKLIASDPEWKILQESQANSIVPDSVAGVFKSGGVYGVVIVEAVGNTSLKKYAEILQGNAAGTAEGLSDLRETTFLEKPAFEYDMVASLNGLSFKYNNLVFIHQGYGYQLFIWSLKQRFDTSFVEEFRKMFSLTPGEIQRRRRQGPLRDFSGVGQQYIGGRFASAVNAIAIEPRGDWRIAIGNELRQMNDDAEVGMVNAKDNLYLVVIPESVSGQTIESYASTVFSRFEEAADDTNEAQIVKYPVGGEMVEFRRFTVDTGLTIKYLAGVHAAGNRLYQILGWWVDGIADTPEKSFAEALTQITFLSPAQVGQLKEQMLTKPDPENSIGPEWSLRQGVYRNFELGLIWQKPKGFWRLTAGEQAAEQSTDSLIFATEVDTAMYLKVITEAADEFENLQEYNEIATENVFGEVKQGTPIMLDGNAAIHSKGIRQSDGQNYAFQVVTTFFEGVESEVATQILIWGTIEDMQNQAVVDAALKGFHFPGNKLKKTDKTDSTYIDHRIGFELKMLESSWGIQDNRVAQFAPVGNMVEFSRPSQAVIITALTVLSPGQNEEVLVNLMKQNVQSRVGQFTNAEPVETKVTFGGLTWNHQKWVDGKKMMHLLTGYRDQTAFALIATDRRGTGDPLLLKIKNGFQLLDGLQLENKIP